MFTKPFDRYACVGDSIHCNVDGIDYAARLEFDFDATGSDCDCYTEEQIAAWERDEWRFVAVVISASAAGVSLGESLESLWGVECNFPGSDNSYLLDVANELLPGAIEAATAELARVRAALYAIPALPSLIHQHHKRAKA